MSIKLINTLLCWFLIFYSQELRSQNNDYSFWCGIKDSSNYTVLFKNGYCGELSYCLSNLYGLPKNQIRYKNKTSRKLYLFFMPYDSMMPLEKKKQVILENIHKFCNIKVFDTTLSIKVYKLIVLDKKKLQSKSVIDKDTLKFFNDYFQMGSFDEGSAGPKINGLDTIWYSKDSFDLKLIWDDFRWYSQNMPLKHIAEPLESALNELVLVGGLPKGKYTYEISTENSKNLRKFNNHLTKTLGLKLVKCKNKVGIKYIEYLE
jgi:hypothetical protein